MKGQLERIWGLCWDSGKQHGDHNSEFRVILGEWKIGDYLGVILWLYWDNGKYNGKCYLGCRV